MKYLILTLLFITTPVLAQQPQCDTRESIVKQLQEKYNEVQSHVGLTNGGAVMEIYQSPEGATYTLLVTLPDGTSCIFGAGENLEETAVERKAPSQGL